jgi:hypothetical protein
MCFGNLSFDNSKVGSVEVDNTTFGGLKFDKRTCPDVFAATKHSVANCDTLCRMAHAPRRILD